MIYGRYAALYDISGQTRFSVLMHTYLDEVLQRHPLVAGRRVLDIACGTGMLALLLADAGWKVTGLDASAEMLAQARGRLAALQEAGQVALVQGDMRALPELLPAAAYDLVTCTYDSLNYLLHEDDLAACLRGVAHVLAPGGLFVADMNTQHFLEHDWGTCEAHEQGGYVQVSQSQFDPQHFTSTMRLTGFVGDDEQGYARFDEIHVERAYPLATVAALLEQAGLHIEAVYDCFTFHAPYPAAQRVAWVARRRDTAPGEASVRSAAHT
jgi:ubiquinone/menaquinone biosynthesis C-methylase UbiE